MSRPSPCSVCSLAWRCLLDTIADLDRAAGAPLLEHIKTNLLAATPRIAEITLRIRWLIVIGVAAALAGAGLRWWQLQRGLDLGDTSWFFAPSNGTVAHVADMFLNGTHPMLPWLAFRCAGMVLARLFETTWWRPVAVVVGLAMFRAATTVSMLVSPGPLATGLSSTDPFDRGMLYTLSALGTALAAFGVVSWLADRYERTAPIRLLGGAGAMTLTLYVAHGLVFNLLVDWFGWVRPSGLETALILSAAYWVIAIAVAAWYHRRFGIGPVEWLYRKLGG